MSFSAAISTVFRKYATFSGRSRRSEYWWWAVFVAIVFAVAAIIEVALGVNVSDVIEGNSAVQWILTVALLLPNLSVTFRRLHDTNKSGWWLLWLLLPFIGLILVLI